MTNKKTWKSNRFRLSDPLNLQRDKFRIVLAGLILELYYSGRLQWEVTGWKGYFCLSQDLNSPDPFSKDFPSLSWIFPGPKFPYCLTGCCLLSQHCGMLWNDMQPVLLSLSWPEACKLVRQSSQLFSAFLPETGELESVISGASCILLMWCFLVCPMACCSAVLSTQHWYLSHCTRLLNSKFCLSVPLLFVCHSPDRAMALRCSLQSKVLQFRDCVGCPNKL